MKKFLLLVSLLLVVPNVAMGAESTAPKPNAAPSKWLSWFRGIPHLTMDHLAKARAYMHSKWRCMVRGEGCSKRQRNALRALSAAIVGAAGVVAGVAAKSYVDRNKRAAAAAKAFHDAAAAETAAADADAAETAAADADAAGAARRAAAWAAADAAAAETAAADADAAETAAADADAAGAARRAAAWAAADAAWDAADSYSAAADAAWDAAADADVAAFRAAANIFSEVKTELDDAAWDAAAKAAAKAADNAAAKAADPKRAKALQALSTALGDPSAVNLNAVEDAIKAMDAQ